MGVPFFRKVVVLQRRYAKNGQRVANKLETNGIALDDEGCDVKEHGFHVGLPIDGPRELHDIYRKTRNDRPTFDYVIAAAHRLADAASFAAPCVVIRRNARHPREAYRFLADEVGTWRVQFNPAVEPQFK